MMERLVDKLKLPEEVGLSDAADILGVSVRTVRRDIDDGILPFRNAAPSRSIQVVYRIPLTAIVELRTSYAVLEKIQPKQQQRRTAKKYKPKTMKRK